MNANGIALSLHLWGQAQSFDVDHLADIFGEEAGIAGRDIAAHRMRNDADGGKVELMDQLRHVIDKTRHFIAAIGRPGAVAMAP